MPRGLRLCYSDAARVPSTHRTGGEIVHDVDPRGPAGYPAPSVRVTRDACKGRIIKPIRIALEA